MNRYNQNYTAIGEEIIYFGSDFAHLQWWQTVMTLRFAHVAWRIFFLEFISDIWIQKIGIFFIIKKNPFSNVLNIENLLKEADELMIVDW